MSHRKLVLWLTLVVLSLTVGMHADDKANCSNATLHGSYGFRATGELFAAVARFTFDGKGGLTATFFGRTPGNPFGPVEFTGTYSVSEDCIVTDSWGPPLNSTHVSVIVDGGKGYFIINSTPSSADGDTVNSGEARRQ
jgi:hypothetical protein